MYKQWISNHIYILLETTFLSIFLFHEIQTKLVGIWSTLILRYLMSARDIFIYIYIYIYIGVAASVNQGVHMGASPTGELKTKFSLLLRVNS